MATVTEILDRGSHVTGLLTTGTERTLALNALNDVYLDAILATGCHQNQSTHTFSTSAGIYTLSTDLSLSDCMQIIDITISSGAYNRKLAQKPVSWITQRRSGLAVAGLPRNFAMVGTTKIMLYPNPSAGSTATITYVQNPTKALHETTADATNETTPTGIPEQFHYSVLLPGLVVQMLDKDQREQLGGIWNERYQAGLYKLAEFTAAFGGTDGAIEDHIHDDGYGLPNDYRGRY